MCDRYVFNELALTGLRLLGVGQSNVKAKPTLGPIAQETGLHEMKRSGTDSDGGLENRPQGSALSG